MNATVVVLADRRRAKLLACAFVALRSVARDVQSAGRLDAALALSLSAQNLVEAAKLLGINDADLENFD